MLATPLAASATETVTTPGPLTRLLVTPDLKCGVSYIGDSHSAFYSDTACGTFIAFDDGGTTTLATPADVPSGATVTSVGTHYTPVSQELTGSGTRSDPYTVTTVARANGSTGAPVLELHQNDSYVVGDGYFTTSTSVASLDGQEHDAILSYGADCYLGDNDTGFGDYDASSGTVTCTASTANDARIEQFIPVTPGSSYYYGRYNSVWEKIAAKASLPDAIDDASARVDNGIALSWPVHVPASGSAAAVTRLTNFSPVSIRPLTTSITASNTTVEAGSTTHLTLTLTNSRNVVGVQPTSLSLALPAGAGYVPDSVEGSDGVPTVSGSTLTIPLSGILAASATRTVTLDVVLGEAGTAGLRLSGAAEPAPVLPSSTSVTVTVPPPAAAPDTADTAYRTPVTLTPLDNDSGTGTVTIVGATQPANGAVTTTGGTLTYTPSKGFSGTDRFSYTIADDTQRTATGTVTVSVAAPPAPVAVDDDASTVEGRPVTVAVLSNDTGADLTIAAISGVKGGTAEVTPDGAVAFTPADSFVGVAQFEYTLADGIGREASAGVRIEVAAVVAPPVVRPTPTTTPPPTAVIVAPPAAAPPAAAPPATAPPTTGATTTPTPSPIEAFSEDLAQTGLEVGAPATGAVGLLAVGAIIALSRRRSTTSAR